MNRVVPPDELRAAVDELAARITRFSDHTIAIGKQAFYRQLDCGEPEAYELTKQVMAANAATADAQEGIGAFLGKRSPSWSGRAKGTRLPRPWEPSLPPLMTCPPPSASILGWSDWMEITQDRVNQFADATGDHQWIHIDPERAAAESPYGATIAHGYLTLSLTNMFLPSLITVEQMSMGINYGVNKVRFPRPVPVGSRIRVGAELSSVTRSPAVSKPSSPSRSKWRAAPSPPAWWRASPAICAEPGYNAAQ